MGLEKGTEVKGKYSIDVGWLSPIFRPQGGKGGRRGVIEI